MSPRARSTALIAAALLLQSCDSNGATGPGNGGLPFATVRGTLDAGNYWTCAVRSAGAAVCAGQNGSGTLGDGSTTERLTPVALSGSIAFRSISGGTSFTCGLSTAGAAYCWGQNYEGKLGDGTTTDRLVPTPVSGGHFFTTVTAGFNSACALDTAKAAWCWGEGALGGDADDRSMVPVAVSGGRTYIAIASPDGDESYHACALADGGAAWCWGDAGSGQLGNGGVVPSSVPVAVSGGHLFKDIGTSDAHACGLTTGGDVWCWGWNHMGQLGDGTVENRSTPVQVGGGRKFAALFVGEYVNCGVTSAGAAWCWGDNRGGRLGAGLPDDYYAAPKLVSGGHTFVVITIGWNFACGRTSGAQVYCWGSNSNGQFGNGSTTSSTLPTLASSWY